MNAFSSQQRPQQQVKRPPSPFLPPPPATIAAAGRSLTAGLALAACLSTSAGGGGNLAFTRASISVAFTFHALLFHVALTMLASAVFTASIRASIDYQCRAVGLDPRGFSLAELKRGGGLGSGGGAAAPVPPHQVQPIREAAVAMTGQPSEGVEGDGAAVAHPSLGGDGPENISAAAVVELPSDGGGGAGDTVAAAPSDVVLAPPPPPSHSAPHDPLTPAQLDQLGRLSSAFARLPYKCAFSGLGCALGLTTLSAAVASIAAELGLNHGAIHHGEGGGAGARAAASTSSALLLLQVASDGSGVIAGGGRSKRQGSRRRRSRAPDGSPALRTNRVVFEQPAAEEEVGVTGGQVGEEAEVEEGSAAQQAPPVAPRQRIRFGIPQGGGAKADAAAAMEAAALEVAAAEVAASASPVSNHEVPPASSAPLPRQAAPLPFSSAFAPPRPVLVPVPDPTGRAPFMLVPLRSTGAAPVAAPLLSLPLPAAESQQPSPPSPPSLPPRVQTMGGAVLSRFAELSASRAAGAPPNV